MADKKDLTELVAEILIELQGVNTHLKRMDSRLESMDGRLGNVENRLESMDGRLARVEEQQAKTNAAIGELRISVTRMADQMEVVQQFDQRLRTLEEIVLKKGA